jgi:hypothetical protein
MLVSGWCGDRLKSGRRTRIESGVIFTTAPPVWAKMENADEG